MANIILGKSDSYQSILSNRMNQHGMIAGATGTGKTVTLKVLIEELSSIGVPTIVSDVKGDLSNLAKAGVMNPKLQERLTELGVDSFDFRNYPVTLWDVYGESGLPLRVSISELGPLLLSQVLDLNETQEGILHIVFQVADDQKLLLVDLKDFTALLQYLNENSREYSQKYGNISGSSISAILRKVLQLQNEGGDLFFGQPAIDIADLMAKDSEGNGIVNILAAQKLVNHPKMYAIFLLYLLSELFEQLPEVGNPDVPKLVFFFDEAHLLFDLPRSVIEKLETVVRLIRSKGVGIYFVTQNPLDINDKISSQLGTKIIHQLRAFSPKELKAIKDISQTLRANDSFDTEREISNLRTGEALFSTLDEKGMPTKVEKVYIMPPHSSFEPLSAEDVTYIVKNNALYQKYAQAVDPVSAFELLQQKVQAAQEEALQEQQKVEQEKQLEQERKEYERQRREYEKQRKEQMRYVDKGIDSFVGTITRSIGREIARGLLGSLTRRR